MKNWDKLFIIGASGHAKVIGDICQSCGYTIDGFVDDDKKKQGSKVLGIPVIGDRLSLLAYQADKTAIAIAIGHNKIREEIYHWCKEKGFIVPAFIHPSAVIAKSAAIDEATVVMAGVSINPDSTIGKGVILNTGCVVEHDNRIGDFTHISANAATGGTVNIGKRTHMGLCSTILPNLSVGDDIIIGAGAVVIRNIESNQIVAGVPAKKIKDN